MACSYEGLDADQLTIGGDMNKLAANIAIGRNHVAVHWRYDYMDSLPLGEAVAISMLREMAGTNPSRVSPSRRSTARDLEA